MCMPRVGTMRRALLTAEIDDDEEAQAAAKE
jgi:hypothetical protein